MLLLPIALLPPRIAAPVALLSWGVLALPAISTDIVFARSLAFYLPLSIGLTFAIWQTYAQEKARQWAENDASCAS